MKIETIVETCLVALYKKDVFNEKLYLKGGQAIRLKEEIDTRFSVDIDFSTPGKIDNVTVFEDHLRSALTTEFRENGLHLFDLKFEKRPKIRRDSLPDFWSGCEILFKLIENEKHSLHIDAKRREALTPEGMASSQLKIDISEYEYCESIEKIKIGSVNVLAYSRVLLFLEKIRAICQQHPDYPFKTPDSRARDYYDIERLWNKTLKENRSGAFIAECRTHLAAVFKAKEVSLEFLSKIFSPTFLEFQKTGWSAVERTVSDRLQRFDYYSETLKDIVSRLTK